MSVACASTHCPFARSVMPETVRFGRLAHVSSTAVNNRSPSRDQLLVCVPLQSPCDNGCEEPSATIVCSSTFLPSTVVVTATPNRPDGRTHTIVPAGTGADWPRWSWRIFQHPRYGFHRESNAAGESCAIAGAAESSASVAASINLLVNRLIMGCILFALKTCNARRLWP